MKNEKQIQKSIELISKRKNFAAKYLKNVVLDVCHGESTEARTATCQVCGRHMKTKKGEIPSRYGYKFASVYNKRHKTKSIYDDIACSKYFLENICMNCVSELEKVLGHVFVKSYAP